MSDWHAFQKVIDYHFKDDSLLKLAFTHSSYSNENKLGKLANNERLEFLGDAVLEIVISEYLFSAFSDLPEGDLTRLRASVVCEPTLAKNARVLDLGSYLLLGKGEETAGGWDKDSILADTYEALIGAVYLDVGLEAARKFIMQTLQDDVCHLKNDFKSFDPKTYLQELIQKDSKEPITYEIVKESGPDHSKQFEAVVKLDGKILGSGIGKSKKEAEQNAAEVAIKQYQTQ